MRRLVALLVSLLVGLAFAGTTAFAAPISTYDAAAVERVDSDQIAAAEAGRAQSRGLREESASPLASASDASTTPALFFVAPRTAQPGTAIKPYYPANNGFYGTPKAATLRPGATFDRYGSDFDRFTSPTGTPIHQRALPPGAEEGAYSAFRVVEPLTVQSGQVAPAFGSFGGGTQYLLPKSVKELLESGVIERVTP